MLQNFIICINAVIPSAVYLLIGIVIKLSGIVTEAEVKKFTRVVFLSLYPFVMFDNLYGKNLAENFNGGLIGFALAFTMFQIAVSWALVCGAEKDNYNRGAIIQAMWRSNIILMGLPVGINIFGKSNSAPIALVILFAVPVYNIMAVVVLESFRGGKVNPLNLMKGVATNPIIVGAAAAVVVSCLGITLSDPIERTISSLGDTTTPMAMILLGASLKIGGAREDLGRVAMCVSGKLIASPLVGIGLAVLLGFRGAELGAIVLMTATPTALASFAMASSMGSNGRLAGEAVVFSTIISCVTIPLWLFLLMTYGMI